MVKSRRILMEPLYFGDKKNSKFGVYHPPNPVCDLEKAVLICQPLMQEHIRSYSACVDLAIQLSHAGFHVFRFDYLGTGDSALGLVDVNLGVWLSDIEAASRELRDISGVNQVSIVGIRMGATLATAAHITNVNHIIMWDPIFDGRCYLRDLKRLHSEMLNSRDHFPILRTDKPKVYAHELVGFVLLEELFNDIALLQLSVKHLDPDMRLDILLSDKNDESTIKILSLREQQIIVHSSGFHPNWDALESLESKLMPFESIKLTIRLLH